MALNIVAERKVKLKGFAEGWDSAYLRVRATSEEERIKYGAILKDLEAGPETPEAEADRVEKLRSVAKEIVLGGQVMSTGDDGKARLTTFHATNSEELDYVVNAMNIHWLTEAVLVATGLNHSRMVEN